MGEGGGGGVQVVDATLDGDLAFLHLFATGV